MSEVIRAENQVDLSLSASEMDEYKAHITDFIRDRVKMAGAEEAIVALSGGIDSTLTSHLAVDALGADSVFGLVLPSEVNRENNMSDAERVASELLEIEYEIMEISPFVDKIVNAAPKSMVSRDDEIQRIAVGNLRARIRTVLNYYAANNRNGLVLGTGNRSEALAGDLTKYGDGAVDCLPIAPFYKKQVRQLARHLGIPEDLASKTASAELWAGQTDEEELGIDYDTLDSILALHIDGPFSSSATAKQLSLDSDVVQRVRKLYENSSHKRQFPPGPDRLH